MDNPKLLIVEDDESIRTQMKWALANDYEILLAGDGGKALQIIESKRPAVVTLDLGLPPSPEGTCEGLRLLGQILKFDSTTKIIVVTGNPDRAAALQAISDGAHDFFTKPVNIDELKAILKRAYYVHSLEAESRFLQKELEKQTAGEMLGTSDKMQAVFTTIRKVASSDVPVLIIGESGTGKELIAQAIHRQSIRKEKPLIPINCGAIPETLMESELFGHEKGAFTGAHTQKKGRFELAAGGTLFLDEIGEIPLLLQVKLLRFLQDHRVERVGGKEPLELDVRIVAATNKDIKKLAEDKLFRDDLYFRLAVVTIEVPPLRERGDDRLLLAKHFLQRYAREAAVTKSLSYEAIGAINRYEWPGNVRELENRIRRAVTLSDGTFITPADLGLESPQDMPETFDLKAAKEEVERRLITLALHKHEGNVSKAAGELGMSRPTLYGLMSKYDISL